jgi:hypothetical protein
MKWVIFNIGIIVRTNKFIVKWKVVYNICGQMFLREIIHNELITYFCQN